MAQIRKRYFEWIDGDDKGLVVSLESISELDGETFYNFDDGESCNLRFISKMTNDIVDLKGKFMVEVENPYNIWTFEPIETQMPKGVKADGDDQIPTLHDFIKSNAGGGSSTADITDSDLGKDKLVQPKKAQQLKPLPKKEDYEEKPIEKIDVPVNQKQQNVEKQPEIDSNKKDEEVINKEGKSSTTPQKRVNSADPIAILVDRCKKHETEIPLTLTVKLPMRSLYEIANSEFENGGDKFIDYIVEGINTDVIVDALKVALKNAYGAIDGE